jgi:hypothetical protein
MLLVLTLVLILAGGSAFGARPAEQRYEPPGAGVSVEVPRGWAVVERPLTPCTDPVQRLALRGHGALLQIVERRDPSPLAAYPPRRARFELPGKPQWIECCAPRDAKGWMVPFRASGRAFYVYAYPGRAGTGAELRRILDSLRVRARR